MIHQQKKQRRRAARVNLTDAVLTIIKIGGLVALAVVAPNTLQYLGVFMDKKRRYLRISHINNSVIGKLLSRGLIKIVKNKTGQNCLAITEQGKFILKKYEFLEKGLPVPKRWDGKYRLVIFDIKEWKRNTRDNLRRWLLNLGFVRLQNSVWVYPYDCAEIIALLKSDFRIGKEILYITAENIENDGWLRREFGLS